MRFQTTRTESQFPNFYRQDRLATVMEVTGNTPATTAVKAQLSKTTIAEALIGECKKMSSMWRIMRALTASEKDCQILWKHIFDLDSQDSEFRRAVAKAGR